MWLPREHSFEIALIQGLRSRAFGVQLLALNVKLASITTAEALQLCLRQFLHVTRYRAVKVCSGWARWLTRRHQAECGCARRTVYLRAVCICRRLYKMVPVGRMLCDVALEPCNDCSVKAFHLSPGLALICDYSQQLDFQSRAHGGEEL